jgi:hypothetical protein
MVPTGFGVPALVRSIGRQRVAGDIRVGVGKCMSIFAFFAILFAVPPTLLAGSIGVRPPLSLTQIIGWCAAQWLVGKLLQVSGNRARERARMRMALQPAIERAMSFR